MGINRKEKEVVDEMEEEVIERERIWELIGMVKKMVRVERTKDRREENEQNGVCANEYGRG